MKRQDEYISPDKRWITLENGEHVLIDKDGNIRSGVSGGMSGERLGRAKTEPKYADKEKTKRKIYDSLTGFRFNENDSPEYKKYIDETVRTLFKRVFQQLPVGEGFYLPSMDYFEGDWLRNHFIKESDSSCVSSDTGEVLEEENFANSFADILTKRFNGEIDSEEDSIFVDGLYEMMTHSSPIQFDENEINRFISTLEKHIEYDLNTAEGRESVWKNILNIIPNYVNGQIYRVAKKNDYDVFPKSLKQSLESLFLSMPEGTSFENEGTKNIKFIKERESWNAYSDGSRYYFRSFSPKDITRYILCGNIESEKAISFIAKHLSKSSQPKTVEEIYNDMKRGTSWNPSVRGATEKHDDYSVLDYMNPYVSEEQRDEFRKKFYDFYKTLMFPRDNIQETVSSYTKVGNFFNDEIEKRASLRISKESEYLRSEGIKACVTSHDVYDVLQDVREFGTDNELSFFALYIGDFGEEKIGEGQLKSMLKIALSAYPTEWLYNILKKSQPKVKVEDTTDGRAYYLHGNYIVISTPGNYETGVYLGKTLAHEMGHNIDCECVFDIDENSHRKIYELNRSFLSSRTVNSPEEVYAVSVEHGKEIVKPDNFFDRYIGKQYVGSNRTSEVLSVMMGTIAASNDIHNDFNTSKDTLSLPYIIGLLALYGNTPSNMSYSLSRKPSEKHRHIISKVSSNSDKFNNYIEEIFERRSEALYKSDMDKVYEIEDELTNQISMLPNNTVITLTDEEFLIDGKPYTTRFVKKRKYFYTLDENGKQSEKFRGIENAAAEYFSRKITRGGVEKIRVDFPQKSHHDSEKVSKFKKRRFDRLTRIRNERISNRKVK